jgi:predicted AlkP superfamily pyrophosphatase or phosphodiesterase
MKALLRTAAWLAASLALTAGCAATTAPVAVTGGKPRLVVVLIVDGLPQRQVVDYRDQLAPDGFERFLARGTWFSDAHYGHAMTVTGPGHATILTGAYPNRTGIIDNEWIDPATGRMENCVGDVSATYIGLKTNRLDGTSPKNLKAESVGDVLKRVEPRSKVIAISAKDRGAILPAGKSGVAYIFHDRYGLFGSTTYYMQEHPKWVEAFNAGHPADEYFHKEWRPLLAESAYARSMPDGQRWSLDAAKLPKTMGEGQKEPGPLFYDELIGSPFSDDLLLNFARAAIAGEALGRDGAPDILVVSLSGHDYVNHAYGAESRTSHDHVLQLDLLLQAFLLDLDATVGRDNYVAVLTADHGFTPAPELSRTLGRDAGRVSLRAIALRANRELVKRYGEGAWIRGVSADGLLMNNKLAADKRVDAASLLEETRKLVLAEPGIVAAYTRAELESGSRKGAPFFEAMRRTWHRDLSGDLQIAVKPYWILAAENGKGTTHGSPHPHDTHVPILFYGPPWVTQARVDTRVDVVDIAPTVARLLGVPAPSACEGKPLPIGAQGS